MNAIEKISEKIEELDNNFNELLQNNKLDINIIENLSINSIEDCKQIINKHIEELILQKINEKELISKKNKNGKN